MVLSAKAGSEYSIRSVVISSCYVLMLGIKASTFVKLPAVRILRKLLNSSNTYKTITNSYE